MAERVIRIILSGDSTGAVRAMVAAGDAAEVTTGKLHKMGAAGHTMQSVGRSMTQIALPLLAIGGYAVNDRGRLPVLDDADPHAGRRGRERGHEDAGRDHEARSEGR